VSTIAPYTSRKNKSVNRNWKLALKKQKHKTNKIILFLPAAFSAPLGPSHSPVLAGSFQAPIIFT